MNAMMMAGFLKALLANVPFASVEYFIASKWVVVTVVGCDTKLRFEEDGREPGSFHLKVVTGVVVEHFDCGNGLNGIRECVRDFMPRIAHRLLPVTY